MPSLNAAADAPDLPLDPAAAAFSEGMGLGARRRREGGGGGETQMVPISWRGYRNRMTRRMTHMTGLMSCTGSSRGPGAAVAAFDHGGGLGRLRGDEFAPPGRRGSTGKGRGSGSRNDITCHLESLKMSQAKHTVQGQAGAQAQHLVKRGGGHPGGGGGSRDHGCLVVRQLKVTYDQLKPCDEACSRAIVAVGAGSSGGRQQQ